MTIRFPAAASAAFVLLGGCVDGVAQPPSLAPRAIERMQFDPPAQPEAPAPTPPDSGLQARLDGFSAALDAADRDFAAALPAARRAATAAGAAGSESWIAAQQQITAVEALAGQASAALADIDSLYLDRANAAAGGGSPAGLDSLRALRARADALVTAQRTAADALKARLDR
ncbi:hypothetical protein ACMT1E_13345 [Sphingomonas flavalba]|uniref:hypothetical protein n=1 Tax=Sphingomonas flavalba TaxID=2559804 RepID=UPI0039E0FC75